MKTENLQLPQDLADIASDHFRLLKPENLKKKRDTVELRLSGYSDVMFLIADIVKVSMLALEAAGDGHRFIPDPPSNISGILSIILDLIPYEEAELLDKIRYSLLASEHHEADDWDFLLRSATLFPLTDMNA